MSRDEGQRGLELDQDIAGQRRGWVGQRVGWVFLALVVAAACAGLFGPGLFSGAIAGQEHGTLWAEYPRFWRVQFPMLIHVHFEAQDATATRARLWLSRDYLQAVSVEHITPEPESVELGADRLTYVLALGAPTGTRMVTLMLEPQARGIVKALIGIDGGPRVEFRQFIYP